MKTKFGKHIESLERQIDAYGCRNFIHATQTQIKLLEKGSPDRLILEFLLKNAKGAKNAKSWKEISKHLKENGTTLSKQKFQTKLLQKSRKSTYFIGSGYKGYFVIESPIDVAMVNEFYEKRVRKESTHQDSAMYLADRYNMRPIPIQEQEPTTDYRP